MFLFFGQSKNLCIGFIGRRNSRTILGEECARRKPLTAPGYWIGQEAWNGVALADKGRNDHRTFPLPPLL
jgi:hypothetical protein